jgi:hypothetical protein
MTNSFVTKVYVYSARAKKVMTVRVLNVGKDCWKVITLQSNAIWYSADTRSFGFDFSSFALIFLLFNRQPLH